MNKYSQIFYHIIDYTSQLLLISKSTVYKQVCHKNYTLNHSMFLTAQGMVNRIESQIQIALNWINNKNIESMFKTKNQYLRYVAVLKVFVQGCRRSLKQMKASLQKQYLSNKSKDIFVYTTPTDYRLLNKNDLPYIKKQLYVFIDQCNNIKGNTFLLLKSRYSSYKINKQSGVSLSIITELRKHRKTIDHLNVNTALLLSNYYDSTPLHHSWKHQVKSVD